MGVGRYLNDMVVGESWTGRPIPMLRDAIIAFAEAFDPQAMHLDESSAAARAFGGIIASGWHVAALVMRDTIETSPFEGNQMLGLGVDDLRWTRPVRPGDVLLALRTIDEVRVSRTKPDRGVLRVSTVVSNQHGEQVMRFSTAIQLPCRPSEGEYLMDREDGRRHLEPRNSRPKT